MVAIICPPRLTEVILDLPVATLPHLTQTIEPLEGKGK